MGRHVRSARAISGSSVGMGGVGAGRETGTHTRPRGWVFDEGMRSVDGAVFGFACPFGRLEEESGPY